MAQSLLPPIPSLLLFYLIKDSGPIRGALTMPIHRLASSSHIFFVDSLNFCHCRNTFLSHKLGSHIRSTAWMSVRRVPEPQETARLHTNTRLGVHWNRSSQKHCWVTSEVTLRPLEKMEYIGEEFGLKSALRASPAQQAGCNVHVQMLPAVEVVLHILREKFLQPQAL